MKPSFLIAGVGLALATIFLLQYWLNRVPEEPAISADAVVAVDQTPAQLPPNSEPTEEAGGTEAAATPALPPLPALDDSDSSVQALLSSWPDDWLAPEQLIRRAATVLDNAATGQYPKQQLQFLAPDGVFKAKKTGGRAFIDPDSYLRFDPLVDALERVPPDALAGIYRRLQPLVVAALAELGQQESPDILLATAMAQLEAVPILESEVRLVRPSVLYQFHDKKLEALSPLQKQLLRMGPDNVRRIQQYLASFRLTL